MSYVWKFSLGGKSFTDFFGADVAAVVAHAIDRAGKALLSSHEHSLDKRIQNSKLSLLSDLQKPEFSHLIKCVSKDSLSFNDAETFFKTMQDIAGRAGLELQIDRIEVKSLSFLAAKVVGRNRFFYSEVQYSKIPNVVFEQYPELHRHPASYMKTQLQVFCDRYMSRHIDTQAYYQLVTLLSVVPKILYSPLKETITKQEYKKHLSASTYKKLIVPIANLMRTVKNKKLSADKLHDRVAAHLAQYLQNDAEGELKFLTRLNQITKLSDSPADELHALLKDPKYPLSEKFRIELKKPLIQIIVHYNEFVLQLNRETRSIVAH